MGPSRVGRGRDIERVLFVEVSLIDQQFLLAVDGQTMVAWPYERRCDGWPAGDLTASHPFSIGAQGVEATVWNLRVHRDAYYADAAGRRGNQRTARPVR